MVLGNLPATATALFYDVMFPALWDAAVAYGVDPVGVVAQSGKETAWGGFPGNVKSWFYNPAGIKVRNNTNVMALLGTTNPDHPLVHQQFPSWTIGAIAQAQHLRAYCNAPFEGMNVDPRWDWVFGNHNCVTWVDLNGKWAGATYGNEVEDGRQRLGGSV